MYPNRYIITMFSIQKTTQFDNWLRKLKDIRAKVKILSRLKSVELGNLGVNKSVGCGVHELKISYGPGYRLYYKKTNKTVILLLIGGDKSSQQKDILKAKRIAEEIGV